MGKRILINRHGAFGDMIHMSHLPRLLMEQGASVVGVHTGYKGRQVLANNPFIDIVHFFEPSGRDITPSYYKFRLAAIGEMYDKIINLHHSLEVGVLALEGQNEFYQHQSVRDRDGVRECYYDLMTELAGFPHLKGKYKGEMFFTEQEIKIVENDLLRDGRFRDNFRVLINIAGSGPHKVFIQSREVAEWILKSFPEAVIFTTGDITTKQLDLDSLGVRVRSLVGKKQFRQVSLMVKYMDLAIGCESGMMCVASMWDIPTIQLMTAACIDNHCKLSKNDLSIQSPARCSPCFKGPYKYYGCPKKGNLPICVYFDVREIQKNISKAYEIWRQKNGR